MVISVGGENAYCAVKVAHSLEQRIKSLFLPGAVPGDTVT